MRYEKIILASLGIICFCIISLVCLQFYNAKQNADILSEIAQIKRIDDLNKEEEEKQIKLFKKACSITEEIYTKEIALNVFKQNQETGLPIPLIYAIIATESDLHKEANSKAGAKFGRGLMQVSEIGLTDYNWKHGTTYTSSDLYNISINLEIGCWIYLQNENYIHSSNFTYLYVAYNIGAKKYNRYKEYYLNDRYPNGDKYMALNRFKYYYNKYTEYFRGFD